jgi:hypothetical protein
VLAPERSRAEFKDGVWRGLWRTHGVSLAFFCVQAPAAVVVMLPALGLSWLLRDSAGTLQTALLAQVVGIVLPGMLLLASAAVVLGQAMLVWRRIGTQSGRLSLGVIFALSASSWPVALAEAGALIGIGLGLGGLAAIGAGVVYGVVWGLAKADALLVADMVSLWIAALMAAVVGGAFLETLGRWVEDQALGAVNAKQAFVFSAWLQGWLSEVVGWFARKGMVAVGAGGCLVIGLVVALLTVRHGELFTSWVALGWFGVAAAVLITLRNTETRP